MDFTTAAELAFRLMEAFGVSIIVIGTLYATAQFFVQRRQRVAGPVAYRTFRVGVARAILLGLEFLVAGDIIRTVAIEPSLDSVAVLAAIVGIRTVLSFTLQLEIEGRWPWQQPRSGQGDSVA